MSIRQAAIGYAERGWPVFPCKPGLKVPNTANGFHDATTDLRQIEWWWQKHPDDNIGIATGEPGPDVLDVDVKSGVNGYEALNRLQRAGLLTGAGLLVRTPSGGLHLYFRGTTQRCGKLTEHGLDFKAAGGYVLAAPSVVGHKMYDLVEERDLEACHSWASDRLVLEPQQPRRVRGRGRPPTGDASRRFPGVVAHLSGLKDGDQRWRQLYWAACRAAEFIEAGQLTEDEARAALMEASRINGFIADHGEHEAIRKIDRGLSAAGRAAG